MATEADTEDSLTGNTIWGFPVETPKSQPAPLTSLVLDQPDAPEISELQMSRRLFKVRLADTQGRRSSAKLLINKMYTWRGYGVEDAPVADRPDRITLVASDEQELLGTLTLGLDSALGLLVDQVYPEEVDSVRRAGRRVCELSKLAVDQRGGSKKVLAALFHIAYIYGRVLNEVTDVFIEVNPRHAAFYQRWLGFEVFGPQRICPRVNAPAQLLRLELSFVDEQIARFGGKADLAATERSLYPYFFSKREERGITERLLQVG